MSNGHDPQPPAPRPVLLYDGDCGFCRDRVRGLQKIVGDRVEFLPFQQGAARFSSIEPDALRNAVHLIEPDGRVSRAAEAIFRVRALAPGRGRLLWWYQKLPPFALASELVYRFTARHRGTISRLTAGSGKTGVRDRSNFVLARWGLRCGMRGSVPRDAYVFFRRTSQRGNGG